MEWDLEPFVPHSRYERISIWILLASSCMHRDALVRVISQIRIDIFTTQRGSNTFWQLIEPHVLCSLRTTCPQMDQITFIPCISVLHVQAIECHQFCWIRTLPWMFVFWLQPLLLAFLHLILDLLHRLLELMMGLKGLLWLHLLDTLWLGQLDTLCYSRFWGSSHPSTCFSITLGFMRLAPYHLPFTRR